MSVILSQKEDIMKAIEACLDKGMTSREDIIYKVQTEFGLTRAKVATYARILKNKYIEQVKILSSETVVKGGTPTHGDKDG